MRCANTKVHAVIVWALCKIEHDTPEAVPFTHLDNVCQTHIVGVNQFTVQRALIDLRESKVAVHQGLDGYTLARSEFGYLLREMAGPSGTPSNLGISRIRTELGRRFAECFPRPSATAVTFAERMRERRRRRKT